MWSPTSSIKTPIPVATVARLDNGSAKYIKNNFLSLFPDLMKYIYQVLYVVKKELDTAKLFFRFEIADFFQKLWQKSAIKSLILATKLDWWGSKLVIKIEGKFLFNFAILIYYESCDLLFWNSRLPWYVHAKFIF